MIIWINGGFGAGKSTLASELAARLDDAVVCDPEHVGLMVWGWVGRGDDFQDLPSWRELVIASVLAVRRHHARTVIVPMSLIRDAYRDEVFGGLAADGEPMLHVFLEADAEVLRRRIGARGAPTGADTSVRDWAWRRIDAAAAAADRQPPGTLRLRSDQLSVGTLADAVLAAAFGDAAAAAGGAASADHNVDQ